MPAQEFRIANRTVYFRKAIRTPDFASEAVLTREPFVFVELWLRRNCVDALPYWEQARHYYMASRGLPPESPPLTLYYFFLNAVKALLIVKKVPYSDRHGVAGGFDPASRRTLSKEKVRIQQAGIMTALSKYLGEQEGDNEYTLTVLLANLAYIHR